MDDNSARGDERLRDHLPEAAVQARHDWCILAQSHIEASLYLEDNNNVYEMWRKLGPPHPKPTVADRLARFNRMYDAVSGGKE
jgi:hypothetical protein